MHSSILKRKIPHKVPYTHHSIHPLLPYVFGSTCFTHALGSGIDKLFRYHNCVFLEYPKSHKVSPLKQFHFLGWHNLYETWNLVPPPLGKLVVGCRWVCTVKVGLDNNVDQLKAFVSLQKAIPRSSGWITVIIFLYLPKWLLCNHSCPLLSFAIGCSINWAWKMSFYMEICLKKCTWSNLLAFLLKGCPLVLYVYIYLQAITQSMVQ